MPRTQIQGSDILQTWGLTKEYEDSIPIQWTLRCAMPISVFKGWGRFQADFFLTGHTQRGQQKGRISCCAIANMLFFAAQEEFSPQRGRQGNSQGHRAPQRLTGSQHCKVRLCCREHQGYDPAPERWFSSFLLSLVHFTNVGGSFCQTMTSSLWGKEPDSNCSFRTSCPAPCQRLCADMGIVNTEKWF